MDEANENLPPSPPLSPAASLNPQLLTSSRSTRSFLAPEWASLGQEQDQCRIRIRAEELRVFSYLRKSVVSNLVLLRRNAAVLDELDCCCSFAALASEQPMVRPVLRDEPSAGHSIVDGRHPIVEAALSQQGNKTFVSNDCFVGSGYKATCPQQGQPAQGQHGLAYLITGPNMAGKSTYLRQNALITLLAQCGAFVPAAFAELSVVDRIFSRVGSADSLHADQSTFMVEMLETATILRTATHRSLVVMDEIGRGTGPEDGAAVAFACLRHLVTVNKCRTLFATHFHSLADMVKDAGLDAEESRGPVAMYCTDVHEDEERGTFMYLHRLRRGVNRESHALKVARLAGLPDLAVDMAAEAIGKNKKGGRTTPEQKWRLRETIQEEHQKNTTPAAYDAAHDSEPDAAVNGQM